MQIFIRFLLVALLLSSIVLRGYSQQPTLKMMWFKHHSGFTNDDQFITDLSVNNDGTVAVTGRATNFVNLDPQTTGNTYSFTNALGYVARYNTNGIITGKGIQSIITNATILNGVAIAQNGRVYTAGSDNNLVSPCIGSLSPGNLPSYITTMGHNGSTNIYNKIYFDAVQAFYAGGQFSGNLTTPNSAVSPVSIVAVSSGLTDGMLVKFDSNRTYKWVYRVGGSGADTIKSVFQFQQHVYAVGVFSGTVDFDPGVGVKSFTAPTTGNGFIVKLDTAGNFIDAWALLSASTNTIEDIKISESGSIYLTGSFSGNTDFDFTAGNNTLGLIGSGTDGFVLKLSSSMITLWTSRFGDAGFESGRKISVINDHVAVGGIFSSNSITIGQITLNNKNSNLTTDGLIYGLDSSGGIRYLYGLGTTGNDQITGIGLNIKQELYVAGWFNGSNFNTELHPSYPANNITSSARDGFLIKFNTYCPIIDQEPRTSYFCAGGAASITSFVHGNNLTYQWLKSGQPLNASSNINGVNNDTLLFNALTINDTASYQLTATSAGCNQVSSGTASIGFLSNTGFPIPVQRYLFNGNLLNTNGGNININLSAAYTNNRFGVSNSAFSFSNAQTALSLNTPFGGSNFTISFWMNLTNLNNQQLISANQSTNCELMIVNGRFQIRFGSNTYQTAKPLTAATWMHITYIKEGTRVKIFINNEKIFDQFNILPASHSIQFIGTGPDFNTGFTGRLDDLQFFNTALSEETASALYLIPEQRFAKVANINKCIGSGIGLRANLYGANATYQWYKDGVMLQNNSQYSGVNSDSITITSLGVADAGRYYAAITSSCVTLFSDTTFISTGNINLSQGLVYNLPLNGNLNNLLQNGNTVTLTNGVTYSNASRFGPHLRSGNFGFQFGSQAATLTPLTGDTISVSFWHFRTSNSSAITTFFSGNSGSARHLIADALGRLGFVNANGVQVLSNYTIPLNQWIHIVFTKAGNTQQIFVNSQLVLTSTVSFLNSLANNQLSRMAGNSSNGELLFGQLDDVLIYNRLLLPFEIEAIRQQILFRTQPSIQRVCNNGTESALFTSLAESIDSTAYQVQWLRNGNIIANGGKFSGAQNDSLFITQVSSNELGNYSIRISPNQFNCHVIETNTAALLTESGSNANDSLRLWFTFSGNSNDQSGRNVTHSSTSITYTNDRFNGTRGAAELNGTSSRILASNVLPTTATSYTFMVWFKANQGIGGLISSTNNLPPALPTAYHPIIYIGNDNKLRGKVYNGDHSTITSNTIVNDNLWHHAAMVVDGTNQVLYLDGRVVGMQTCEGIQLPSNIVIGGSYAAASTYPSHINGWQYFQGQLDDIKVYNRALSSNEILRQSQLLGFAFSGANLIQGCAGSSVLISSGASGNAITQQWRRNGLLLSNTTNVLATDSSTLRILSIAPVDTGIYLSTINSNCLSIISDSIRVRIPSAVQIVSQPIGGNTCPGTLLQLTSRINGFNPVLQWKLNGNNLNNGGRITGANSDTLRITNSSSSDEGNYQLSVTDGCNNVVNSTIVNVGVQYLSAPTLATSAIYPLNGNALAIPTTRNGTAVSVTGAADRFNQTGAAANFIRAFSSRVTTPNGLVGTGSAAYSVSVWFKTSLINTTMGLISFNSGHPTAIPSQSWNPVLYVDNTGKLRGKVYDVNVNSVGTTNSVADGTWHHAVITGDGFNQRLYVDGQLIGTNSSTTAYNFTLAQFITIGASYGGTNNTVWQNHTAGWQFFEGDIDDVRFYTYSLNANQVNDLYTRPTITGQPNTNYSGCIGSSTQISITASGNNIGYQWRKNGAIITDGATYSGSQTATLSINQIQPMDSGRYSCDVNFGCLKISTDTTRLVINNPALVTNEPVNQSSCAGGNVSINFGFSGNNLTFRWQKNNADLSNGGNISGAASALLNINNLSASDTGNYRCIINNSCGGDTTINVYVSLTAGISILQQPNNSTFCVGNLNLLTIKVNDANATFTWRKNGVPINNSNNDTLLFTNTQLSDSGNYSVSVNSNCGSITSSIASVNVVPQITIQQQPQPASNVCSGRTLQLTVILNSTNGISSIQWSKNGQSISGANGLSLIKPNMSVSDTGLYLCSIQTICGQLITNQARVNIIDESLSINQQPVDTIRTCKSNVVNISFTGSFPNANFTWFKNGNLLLNTTTPMLSINGSSLTNNDVYRCRINGRCDTLFTTSTSILLLDSTLINNFSSSKSVVCEGNQVELNVDASGNNLIYTWRRNNTILGNSTNKLMINSFAITDTGAYEVTVSGNCGQVISNKIQLNQAAPVQLTIFNSDTAKYCGSYNGDVPVEIQAGGSITQYKWYLNNILLQDGSNATGTNTNRLVIRNLTSGFYQVKAVVIGACDSVTSDAKVISIAPLPSFVSQPVNKQICAGLTTGFKITTSNTKEIRWFANNIQLTDITNKISGATTDSITLINVNTVDFNSLSNVNIYAVITGECVSDTIRSTTANLTINQPVQVITSPNNQQVCEGSDVSFNISISGNGNVVWLKNGNIIQGAPNALTLNINDVTLQDSGIYNYRISNVCSSIDGSGFSLNVFALPNAVINRLSDSAFVTESFASYKWLFNNSIIIGATSRNIRLTTSGNYRVIVSNSNGCIDTSDAINYNAIGLNQVIQEETAISIYPNPAENQINIIVGDNFKEAELTIIQINGQLVHQSYIRSTESMIDISELATGFYWVNVTNRDGVRKVIKLLIN